MLSPESFVFIWCASVADLFEIAEKLDSAVENLPHLLVLQALLGDDVLLSLGGVEVYRKLNALRLVHSERQIRLFLEVFEAESLQIFFGQRLCVKNASRCGWFISLLPMRHVGRLLLLG